MLGVKGIQADLEILQLIKEIFLCVEIRDITFRLNYLGSKEIQKKYQEKLVIFLDQKKILLCFNCQERYQKGNLLRILDCIICRKKCEFPSYNII